MCKTLQIGLILACVTLSVQGAVFKVNTAQAQNSQSVWVSSVDESEETEYNILLARHFKEEYRYELARQYLLLALATCRTGEMRAYIQRELKSIRLQIQTLR